MSPQKLLHVRLSPQILLLDPPEVSHHDADEDVVFVRRVTTRRLACVTTCPPKKNATFQIHDAHWEHENILNASRCQKRPFLPHHSGTVGIRDGQDIAEVFANIANAGSWSADYDFNKNPARTSSRKVIEQDSQWRAYWKYIEVIDIL